MMTVTQSMLSLSITFGCDSEKVSEDVDKEREELFCALALLRFVRQGLDF